MKKIVKETLFGLLILVFGMMPAMALDWDGPESQYAGGFNPGVGHGGFGGGTCTVSNVPVVFLHGNGDKSLNWDFPPGQVTEIAGYTAPANSVYDTFIAKGYNPCELFGVTYLTADEQAAPQNNYHQEKYYEIIGPFIKAVLDYTGADKVDIVTHSFGVSLGLATLKYYTEEDTSLVPGGLWAKVRKFVNISGGIRGLGSCEWMGTANPLAPTCASQNWYNDYVFGFHPYYNSWAGSVSDFSMRNAPERHPMTRFYTINSGYHDQIHCTIAGMSGSGCDQGALFDDDPINVVAQLNVGGGPTASEMDFDFSDQSVYNMGGGDAGGIGHFRAKNNTGEILYNMLATSCSGEGCSENYGGPAVESDADRPLVLASDVSASELTWDGLDFQYSGGFNPGVGYGGFGGADNCDATRPPVIFIHGNGDNALNWDFPPGAVTEIPGYTAAENSVYDEFIAQGYKPCELFGLTYLSESEQENPQNNYHEPDIYEMIGTFVKAVLDYTGADQVDVVTHSFGVSNALATLKYYTDENTSLIPGGMWSKIRRFVNISGGVRGLGSCAWMGTANPFAPTCGAQNWFNGYIFGFNPIANSWTGSSGEFSMRQAPKYAAGTLFYTLHSGEHDQIHCTIAGMGGSGCDEGALFAVYPNVRSQLNVGGGPTASEMDFDFSDMAIYTMGGGDAGGIGHFRSKNNTGTITFAMLNTECQGIECAENYGGPAIDSGSYSEGTGDGVQGEMDADQSVNDGEWFLTTVTVPAGASQLKAVMTPYENKDFDLYVRKGAQPERYEYDCKPYLLSGETETCVMSDPEADTWHVGVLGYDTGTFHLEITVSE